jgi:serine protease Do
VNLQDIGADRAKALKLPEEEGVEITRVEANSPAATAGLQAGDAVVEYNGQRVEGIEQFSRLVRETPAGREVKLKVYRNGAAQTVTAKVGSHSVGVISQIFPQGPGNGSAWPDSLQTFMSTWRSSGLGVEVEALSGQLADYFGVKEGVLVRSVIKDSAADKAGIKAGDVIVKAGDSKIATPADLTSRIRPSLRRQAVPLTLMRDHKEMTLSVQGDGTARAEQ